MSGKLLNCVHIVIYVWCTLSVMVHSFKLYSEAELGSGDFGSDELLQRQGNALQRSSFNESRSTENLKTALQADINDFIDLIPADEVAAKMVEFYRSDFDVNHVFNYVNSDEFKRLQRNIIGSTEYRDLDAFMVDIGVNVQTIYRRIDGLLGFSTLSVSKHYQAISSNEPTTSPVQTTIGGLNALIEEILSMLPQDGIFIMFFDKLDSSLAFSNMVEQIGSPEFIQKFDALRKSLVMRDAVFAVSQHNVDVKKVLELLSSYFLFGTF